MPRILILQHYYYPDDVVGAQQFTGLCEGLVQRGYEIEVWPANRACHDPKVSYSTRPETIKGVIIRRVWRPAFRQHSFMGRIINSLWMQKLWCLRLAFAPGYKPDIILTGTDPLFSAISIPFLKLLRPKAKIVQWCFDLYPEAAVADGIVKETSIVVRVIRFFLKKAYQKCDLIVDLGSCMRRLLTNYSEKPGVTLTPWALVEPSESLPFDTQERKALFWDSLLGLLYSGSFGRSHDYELTLALARKMKDKGIFVYGVRGSRLDELKQAVTAVDTNVRFTGFAEQDKLSARLSAPDIHMVSIRPEWTGIVVPSKFFGALAVGRPVLFEGSEESAIAGWIREHRVGWVLKSDNLNEIAAELVVLCGDAEKKAALFKHCHQIYQSHFSQKTILTHWDELLRKIMNGNL